MEKKHHVAERPRIAILGPDPVVAATLAGVLPGDVRAAATWTDYCRTYAPEETDIAIVFGQTNPDLLVRLASLGGRYLLAIGDDDVSQSALAPVFGWDRRSQQERELTANYEALGRFFESATRQLVDAIGGSAPSFIVTEAGESTPLLWTESGRNIAVHYCASGRVAKAESGSLDVLSVPTQADPAIWATALLRWINTKSPAVVPNPPARLIAADEWYTPDEQQVAKRIIETESEIERLRAERDGLTSELRTSLDSPPDGPKRLLTSDGEDLVAATVEVFNQLGFDVRDMDGETENGQPKREDLRVTIQSNDEWIAIVEVKGYGKGAKVGDLRQIRSHRDNFISETHKPPNATWWVMNENRLITDPSLRPPLGADVDDQCRLVETTAIRTTILFRLWREVVAGNVDAAEARLRLTNLEPGAIQDSLAS